MFFERFFWGEPKVQIWEGQQDSSLVRCYSANYNYSNQVTAFVVFPDCCKPIFLTKCSQCGPYYGSDELMIGTRQARIAGHARCLFQLEGQCWKVLDVLNFILIVSNSAKWLIDWGWLLELGSYLNMFPNVYKIRKVTGNMILIRFRQMGSFYFALCMLWIIQTVGLFRYVWDCFLSFLCFPGNLHDIADTFSILLMCNLP